MYGHPERRLKKNQSRPKKFLNRRNRAAKLIASKRLEREIMNRFRKHNARLAMLLAGFSLLFGFSSCETATNLVSSTQFSQNAYGFFAADENVIRPFDLRRQPGLRTDGPGYGRGRGDGQLRHLAGQQRWAQQD